MADNGVRRSFEEVIGEEIDRLYRGALLLAGNDADQAERILTTALVEARRGHNHESAGVDGSRLWLDTVLARTFLSLEGATNGGPDVPVSAPAPLDTAALPGGRLPPSIGLLALARTAAGLPPAHRVAVWLSLVGRRGTREVGQILGTDEEAVTGLVGSGYRYMRNAILVGGSNRQAERRNES
ncbi:MAG: hypothetical protein WEA09_02795 [Gemmatimonadota bacterium]